MKKWEYKLLITDANDRERQLEVLQDLGEEGWEMVTAETNNQFVEFWLKRERL